MQNSGFFARLFNRTGHTLVPAPNTPAAGETAPPPIARGPEQPDAKVKTSDLRLPENTFLGEVPGRYAGELPRYRAQGGLFDPNANSITYSHGDMVRFYFLSMVFDLTTRENIPGDVVELGVWKGDTAVLLATYARQSGRTAYLLDTYEGFDDRDLTEAEKHLSKSFSETSLEAVQQRVGTENTSLIKGYFPDSAVQLPDGISYAIVHIDADLYAPIKAALEYFYPRTAPGGFIVMHDYMSLCWEGAIAAIDEFFADKPEFIIPIPDLAGTVVVRKTLRA